MAHSPENKPYSASPDLADYVLQRFQPEDAVLARVRERAKARGIPPIHVSAFDGRLLEVLARAATPRRIVEIGTLAGYSGICLARALAPGGLLYTLEIDPAHAEVARESFADAGVLDRVEIHVGLAYETLCRFPSDCADVVFVDADKQSYPSYVRWAAGALRVGGLVILDNAFAWGLLARPDGPFKDENEERSVRALDTANRLLADPEGPFRSMMIPTSEGLAVGVRVR